VRDRFYRIVER